MPGETVRLNCAYIHNRALNWKHHSIGDDLPHYVYDSVIGMAPFYRQRYKIEESDGSFDLVIRNISRGDAGNFECSDDIEQKSDVELVVLGETSIILIMLVSIFYIYVACVL